MMGEEVKMSEYEANGEGDDREEERVMEWEIGLPSGDELTPLSHPLISSELASAFSISPEPSRSMHDVNRASQSTLSSLCNASSSNASVKSFAVEENRVRSGCEGSDPKRQKKSDGAGSGSGGGGGAEEADSGTEDLATARTLKRPRLVWTPQLHKRFVDVVAHLGIKNAVPKTIMQLMNVEGLTRENVASHLQKYRLYLKRMQGLTNEGPSSTDQLFASTPVPPQSFHSGAEGGKGGAVAMPIPVPYGAPMMPMPVYGHMGMQGYHNHNHAGGSGPGLESNPYMLQQRDWPGNKYGSVAPYPPVGGGGGGGVSDK